MNVPVFRTSLCDVREYPLRRLSGGLACINGWAIEHWVGRQRPPCGDRADRGVPEVRWRRIACGAESRTDVGSRQQERQTLQIRRCEIQQSVRRRLKRAYL